MSDDVDLGETVTPKSTQLNADDLVTGPRTIRITKVTTFAKEQPIAIYFEGDDGRPYLPCKIMRRVLIRLWGRNGGEYVGRSLTLYRDEKVKYGAVEVGGIRISHASHITEPISVMTTESKASRRPFKVLPLSAEQPRRLSWRDLLASVRARVKAGEAIESIEAGEEVAIIREKGTDAHKAELGAILAPADGTA